MNTINHNHNHHHHHHQNPLQTNQCFLLAILIFVLMITPSVQSMKCHICHTNDNNECQLQDCPADQAYDRCMTTLYKNPVDGKTIKKECALAPCHLRGLNFANFKSNCESSKQDDCVFCCNEDGCNKDSAILSHPILNGLISICLMLSSTLLYWYFS